MDAVHIGSLAYGCDAEILQDGGRQRIFGRLLDLLQSEQRAARAHIVQERGQQLHRVQAPRRQSDALICAVKGTRIVDGAALVVLALFLEDLFHIVPRIHAEDIGGIVDDEELLARDLRPFGRHRPQDAIRKRAVSPSIEMKKAVEAAVLEEAAQKERDEEQEAKTSLIHAPHLLPSSGSPASLRSSGALAVA